MFIAVGSSVIAHFPVVCVCVLRVSLLLDDCLFFSDGLRTRLVFAEIALQRPHILLLDEPTNHASMEMIDSMANAIKQFQGGVIVISHDFRLLQQVNYIRDETRGFVSKRARGGWWAGGGGNTQSLPTSVVWHFEL